MTGAFHVPAVDMGCARAQHVLRSDCNSLWYSRCNKYLHMHSILFRALIIAKRIQSTDISKLGL